MAGVITSGAHPKALWPGVKEWFGRTYDEHPVEYTDLFEVDSSSKSYEEDVQVTGFGLAPIKPEGDSVAYDSESQGYTKRYTHVAYALGFIVTYEEMRDNLYPVVGKRRGQALAFSMRQTKEIVAANVYNRAATSGYNGGDGVVLLSTAHPSKSGNQSNTLATAADLSEASLEDMAVQIAQTTNDRGLKISIMPRALIIPPQLQFEAHRVVKSTLQNDSANNAVNALRAMNVFPEGIRMNHYLTDPDAWFISTNCPRGMILYDRDILPLEQDNDFDTKNAKAKKYERYSVGWTDWRGLAGSVGA